MEMPDLPITFPEEPPSLSCPLKYNVVCILIASVALADL